MLNVIGRFGLQHRRFSRKPEGRDLAGQWGHGITFAQ